MSNIVGLDPNQVRVYIPKADRNLTEEEKPMKIHVRLLRARDAAKFRDEIYDISGMGKKRKERLRSGSHELRVLYTCVEDWENFPDENGNQIECKKRKGNNGEFIIDNIDYWPDDLRTEVARYCSRESEVDEEESEERSSSQSSGLNGLEEDS
jgi:hypothetical protein